MFEKSNEIQIKETSDFRCINEYFANGFSDSPVTVKMRIRHYFGNNGQSIASDRQRQNEELADRNDNEFNTQKSPVPSTIDDSVKVIE